jgi:hypothetical protein
MAQMRDADFLAAAVGEVGMAWGHTQRALLQCRRMGRWDVSQLAIELNEIGNRLIRMEDVLRNVYREVQDRVGDDGAAG